MRRTIPVLLLLVGCHVTSFGQGGPAKCEFFPDKDMDGYGLDSGVRHLSCTEPHQGFVPEGGDCDDENPMVHPEANEVCNGQDDNCDGVVDDEATTWYEDADGDGYGDPLALLLACEPIKGYVTDNTDCDDTNPEIHPGAVEQCNGIDDDCDGSIKDDTPTWYEDADGDGYGDVESTEESCKAPNGYVSDASDCDDDNPSVHPDVLDDCDKIDNDCDGIIDEDGDSNGDGVPDCEAVTLLEENFDDASWDGWDVLELGSSGETWVFADGALFEQSDSGNSVAVGPELGDAERYTINADIMLPDGRCNGAGIAFDWADTGNFLMLQWLDPTATYGWYPTGGNLQLYSCVGYSCETLAADDGSPLLFGTYDVWVSFRIVVDGRDVTAYVDDAPEVTATIPGTGTLGPAHVGFWSNDADMGVYFDNLLVTSP